MSLWRITARFGAILFLPCLAFAAEPAAETLLARHLLAAPELKETIVTIVGQQVPAGTEAELATGIVRSDERIWKALEEELPAHLAARLARERIQALARSYAENPQQEWTASGAEITTLALDLSKVDNRFSRALTRTACLAGLLGPNIDRAKEKAGKTNPFKATPQAMEALEPMIQRFGATCDCLIARQIEVFGAERILNARVSLEEVDALTQKIIETGQCPHPLEGLNF